MILAQKDKLNNHWRWMERELDGQGIKGDQLWGKENGSGLGMRMEITGHIAGSSWRLGMGTIQGIYRGDPR